MADKELTFWDHLDELRRVLFRVLGVWFVLAVGYFIAMPWLFDNVVLAPCHNDFVFYDVLRYVGKVFDLHDDFFTQDFHVKLININLAAPFFIHMSTAFWMSVVTATPYIFFEIWRFISPALYANERRGVKKALCIGTVMFFLGVLQSRRQQSNDGRKTSSCLHHLLRRTRVGVYAPASGMQLQHEVAQRDMPRKRPFHRRYG